MWKNKHVVIAMLVAPILALIAYFATDYVVSERPHAARADADYPLLAKSNCRYPSGLCELENGEVKLTLRADLAPPQPSRLTLTSALPLRGARVALVAQPGDEPPAEDLERDDAGAMNWSIELPAVPLQEARVRLVVVVGDSRYFAEVPAVFFERPETLSR